MGFLFLVSRDLDELRRIGSGYFVSTQPTREVAVMAAWEQLLVPLAGNNKSSEAPAALTTLC